MIRCKAPLVTHALPLLLLGLRLFTEDPDCVKNTVDLSLSAGSETSMVTQRWDTMLDSNTMTPYVNASALLKNQRFQHCRLGSGSKDAVAVARCGYGPSGSATAPPGSVQARNYPGSSRRSKIPSSSIGSSAERHSDRPR